MKKEAIPIIVFFLLEVLLWIPLYKIDESYKVNLFIASNQMFRPDTYAEFTTKWLLFIIIFNYASKVTTDKFLKRVLKSIAVYFLMAMVCWWINPKLNMFYPLFGMASYWLMAIDKKFNGVTLIFKSFYNTFLKK